MTAKEEMALMMRLFEILVELDADARSRVLTWVIARCAEEDKKPKGVKP